MNTRNIGFSMWISVLWTWAPWHILWTPGWWGLDRSAVRGCGVLQGTGSHPTQLGIPFSHLIVFHSVKIIISSIINFKRLVGNYYTTGDWQSILLNLWATFRLKQQMIVWRSRLLLLNSTNGIWISYFSVS